jgi:DCN1-like protein 1/2
LTGASWNVQQALDNYFNNTGGNLSVSTTTKEMDDVFAKYKEIGLKETGDPSIDAIQGDGLVELFNDLAVDPTSISAFVVCYKFNMKAAFVLTRDEWLGTLSDYSVTSFNSLKQKVPQWKNELKNSDDYRSFYIFVFEYSKEHGSRTLPHEVAVPTWKVILGDKSILTYKYLDKWCEYVEKDYNKAIMKDTWVQFLEFIKSGIELTKYEDDGAWPSVIDGFVDYMKEKKYI